MSGIQHRFPLGYNLFMKIAEPRNVRLVMLAIYIGAIFAGHGVLTEPPITFERVLGSFLTLWMGLFLIVGGVLSAIAVLPGVWWLERVGLIAIGTGFGMYVIIIFELGHSPFAFWGTYIIVMFLILRWLDIRKFQLAPREE